MSEMVEPLTLQSYVPNYFIPGLKWTAMAWVTYHSVQKTWEGRRKKHAKDKPLVRDFRFREEHLPTWWYVHGKQNINGKERNFFPIIFCMFFSIFPPRPSHTSHPHTPPDGWPWSPGFPAHFLFGLSKRRWFTGTPTCLSTSFHTGNRGSIVPSLPWALAPCSLPDFLSHPFSLPAHNWLSHLPVNIWSFAPSSVCLPLLGPLSERGVPQVWRFHPSPRTSFT